MRVATGEIEEEISGVEGAFGGDVDYAMLVKIYGNTTEAKGRYSPAESSAQRKSASKATDPK